MTQLSLVPPTSASVSLQAADLTGFAQFYPLLRVLTVTEEGNFYERLQLLLTLAQWPGEPPTLAEVARPFSTPTEKIAQTLSLLRRAGWLVSGMDDRRYNLSAPGRMLITLLQLLAQPWQEGDVTAFAAHLYEAADSLGVRQDLLNAQFELVQTTLEERARQLETILESEDTQLVRTRLGQSAQDVKIARKALELRQQKAVAAEAYEAVQRLHTAISRLSNLAARLNQRYQKLLARDLLAQGGVTLGDILTWAREADENDIAAALNPFLLLPYLPLWSLPEMALLDASVEIDGRLPTPYHVPVPQPQPIPELPPTVDLDEIKQLLYQKQALLRQRLHEQDPLPLPQWVDEMDWQTAVVHFAAALDPALMEMETAVYLHLDEQGALETDVAIIQAISKGLLSLHPFPQELNR